MFELNSLRDLHVLRLAVIQVPASLKMRLACTSGVAERGWRGGLFCWSVFNESDHAERIWPLARRGPVITTSCFPFFHPVHYWTNNLWGEKRMYLPSSFYLVLFPSARLHFAKYRFGGLKITNWQQCEQSCKHARGKRKKKVWKSAYEVCAME